MNNILKIAKGIESEIITHRRTIHKNPEIGFDLPKTTQYVKDTLVSYGYAPYDVGDHGVCATIGKGGKTFLIRGDMDALPMQEETDLPFKSCNGYAHTCGHDIHTAAMLGAARILKELEGELEGTVKLMFQPCEERMHGASSMVKDGLMENPKVNAAMALHVTHEKTGSVGYARQIASASNDFFKITIKGVGGHGAAPHETIDPINVAAHLHLALQALNSREVNPDELVILTVCMIESGTAPNIIPETAVMQGSIRTMNSKVRSFVKDRVLEIAKGIATTFHATCEVAYEGEGAPPMLNDDKLLNDANKYIDDMLGEGTCYTMPRMTGSEDFAVLSEMVPSILLWVGTGSKEEGYPHGVHHPKVTFNEEAIHKMSAIYVQCAMNWLHDNK